MNLSQNIKDFFSFTSFARKDKKDTSVYPFQTFLEYKIPYAEFFYSQEYKELLTKIKETIDGVIIKPNQTFSYWKIIGTPPSLPEKKLTISPFSIISGLIYHHSLICGLQVIERHPHLSDTFQGNRRLFPLGADAEVLYNSQDLRIKNILSFPVKLKIEITSQSINGYLLSTEKIFPNEIHFRCTEFKNYKEVLTRVNRRTIAVSVYKKN
jgi:vancomycin resistance protein VanW